MEKISLLVMLALSCGCGRHELGGAPADAGESDAGAADAAVDLGHCGDRIGPSCGARVGLGEDDLYTCQGNSEVPPQLARHCTGACLSSDAGTDGCPCPNGNGTYCGDAVGLAAGSVYQCTGGELSLVHACAAGCVHAGDGGTDACSPCPLGNGLYCGGDSVTGDPNILYQCSGGVLSVAQLCGHACTRMPSRVNDTCGPCPNGDGLYCGGPVGLNPNTLYLCSGGNYSVSQSCPTTCHVAPPRQNDYCEGQGLLCSNVQWWNSAITYQSRVWNGGYDWVDTDLAIVSWTPIQLRHDSKLVQHPVEPWGWQPRFVDQVTGETFQFLHLHPQAQYTTSDGTVYPAGTIVGKSGGNTSDTGYGTYSTGAHLCVQTLAAWTTCFPPGHDACH